MNIKNILLSALVGAVIASLVFICGGLIGNQSADLGGHTRFPHSDLSAKSLTADSGGLTVTAGGLTVTAGATSLSSTLGVMGATTLGSSGTAITQYKCDTAVWNPGSVSSSTAPASLDIANTGAVNGDVALASLDSATSTALWNVYAQVTGSATTTIYLEGISGAAVDLSTTTAKVCTFQ